MLTSSRRKFLGSSLAAAAAVPLRRLTAQGDASPPAGEVFRSFDRMLLLEEKGAQELFFTTWP